MWELWGEGGVCSSLAMRALASCFLLFPCTVPPTAGILVWQDWEKPECVGKRVGQFSGPLCSVLYSTTSWAWSGTSILGPGADSHREDEGHLTLPAPSFHSALLSSVLLVILDLRSLDIISTDTRLGGSWLALLAGDLGTVSCFIDAQAIM